MLHFENRGETAGLFATVAVLTAMGIILFFLVGWVEELGHFVAALCQGDAVSAATTRRQSRSFAEAMC
jgi:hypothetical protein